MSPRPITVDDGTGTAPNVSSPLTDGFLDSPLTEGP